MSIYLFKQNGAILLQLLTIFSRCLFSLNTSLTLSSQLDHITLFNIIVQYQQSYKNNTSFVNL